MSSALRMRCFFILGLLVALVNVSLVATDDCLRAITIGDPKRDPRNVIGLQDPSLCDAFLDRGTWYRFTSGDSEGQLPEYCVEIFHCGTYAPIWMSGSHPTENNPGPVTRKVCAQYWTQGDCCAWSGQVNVKWCRNSATGQEYYIYQLEPPPVCSMAYCANTAPLTARTTPAPLCSRDCAWNNVISRCSCPKYPVMTAPVLSNPYISDSQQVTGTDGKSFSATKFSLSCTVGYPKQSADDGARFRVNFYINAKPADKTFQVTSTNPTAVLDESDIREKLGSEVSCTVSSLWNSTNPEESASRPSNKVFVGIIPIDNFGNQIDRIDMRENQEYSFRMKATFPITCAECFNRQKNVSCEANYTFRVSANTQTFMGDCTFYFTPSKTISDVIKIRPMPTVGKRLIPFNWNLDFDRQTNYPNTIYYGYKIQSIPVTIEDLTPRPMCSSTGDPHITTFGTTNNPKKTYNMYLLGDFVLVNITRSVLEIQVRQFPCNGGAATCNCGVMIREGNNILGVDSCPRSANPLDWTPKIIQTLSDKATHGMTVSQTGSGWTINLISGIQVNVDRGWTDGVLDIHVIGLAVESHNYGGLCSYNGKDNDISTDDGAKYRVQKSFFEYRLQDLPQCVDESYTAPTCDCSGINSDNSISVGCPYSNKTLQQLGPFFSCKLSRRKRRYAPEPSAYPIDLNSLYNNYCQTLQLKSGQPLREANRQVAIQKCTDALTSSSIYQTCRELQNLGETSLINSCATDYQISGDLRVTNSIRTQLERLCVYAIESSMNERSSGSDPNTESLKRKLQQVKANICPQQCSQQGTCINGVCQCYSGFMSRDCSLRRGQAPYIVNSLTPLCDQRKKSCQKVFLEAVNVSTTTTLTCRLRSNSGQVWIDTAPAVSGGVVICYFPSLTSAGIYFMALSNDRSTYSSEKRFDLCDSGTGQCMSTTSTSTTTSTTTPRRTSMPTTLAITSRSTTLPINYRL